MITLFIILLCGIPFANFIFRELDLWHAQGHFAQLLILIMFACSFFMKKNVVKVKNIPLGSLVLWIGLSTLLYNYSAMLRGGYSLSLYALFNFLCCVLFYQLCVQYLNRKRIERILEYLKYMLIITLFYCVLQQFDLDQFFKSGGPVVVGFAGNPSHLGAYLAICSPLLFGKKLLNVLSTILLWIILLFLTKWVGQSLGSVSICGVVTGGIVAFYYIIKRLKWNMLFSYSILCSIVLAISYQFLNNPIFKSFTSFGGRIGFWKYYWEKASDSFIVGKGLNSVNVISSASETYSSVKHLHNEYFHFLFELGLIGLILIIYCIWGFYKLKVKEDKTVLILKSIFLGFIVACLFIYSAHLWVVALVGIFAYSSLYAIKNEELR